MSYQICNKSTLRQWQAKYTDCHHVLEDWHKKMRTGEWSTFLDIKNAFGYVDQTKSNIESASRLIFNIKGNNYRLICDIYYVQKRILLKGFYTHSDYSKIGSFAGKTM